MEYVPVLSEMVHGRDSLEEVTRNSISLIIYLNPVIIPFQICMSCRLRCLLHYTDFKCVFRITVYLRMVVLFSLLDFCHLGECGICTCIK